MHQYIILRLLLHSVSYPINNMSLSPPSFPPQIHPINVKEAVPPITPTPSMCYPVSDRFLSNLSISWHLPTTSCGLPTPVCAFMVELSYSLSITPVSTVSLCSTWPGLSFLSLGQSYVISFCRQSL